MLAILGYIGAFVSFLVVTFVPFFVKKFGAYIVKSTIQKTASIIVIGLNISFFSAVLVFISETYTRFKGVIDIINNAKVSGSEASSVFSCFLNLLHASGIASGFNSAFSFLITVVIFFFIRAAYAITLKSAKTVSDEISKNLKLI